MASCSPPPFAFAFGAGRGPGFGASKREIGQWLSSSPLFGPLSLVLRECATHRPSIFDAIPTPAPPPPPAAHAPVSFVRFREWHQHKQDHPTQAKPESSSPMILTTPHSTTTSAITASSPALAPTPTPTPTVASTSRRGDVRQQYEWYLGLHSAVDERTVSLCRIADQLAHESYGMRPMLPNQQGHLRAPLIQRHTRAKHLINHRFRSPQEPPASPDDTTTTIDTTDAHETSTATTTAPTPAPAPASERDSHRPTAPPPVVPVPAIPSVVPSTTAATERSASVMPPSLPAPAAAAPRRAPTPTTPTPAPAPKRRPNSPESSSDGDGHRGREVSDDDDDDDDDGRAPRRGRRRVTTSGKAKATKNKKRSTKVKAGKPRGALNRAAVAHLKTFLFNNFHNPYPTDDEKRQLAVETGLEVAQVNYWFINARVRIWRPLLQSMEKSAKAKLAQGVGGGGSVVSSGAGAAKSKSNPPNKKSVAAPRKRVAATTPRRR